MFDINLMSRIRQDRAAETEGIHAAEYRPRASKDPGRHKKI